MAADTTPKIDDELDRRVLKSSAWVAAGYGVRSLLSMGSMLVLARLVEPKAFGLLALAFIFVGLVTHVQSGGIHAAVIYLREDVETAASSAFAYACAAGVAGYGIVFVLASPAEHLLHAPGLAGVLRVFALVLVASSLEAVPAALLERELNFRARTRAELSGAVVQTVVTLALAVAGYGVWSLVIGQVLGMTIEMLGMWVLARWRPSRRRFSWPMLRRMLRFGRFVGAGNVIGLVNETVDNLLVGRLLGTTLLGFYSVTFRLADLPTSVIGYVVGRVMLPAYSTVQDDLDRFRRAFLQNVQRVALLSLPVAVALGVAAHDVVAGLLGPRWLPGVPALRILAVYTIVRSFASCAGAAFQALGKPHLVPVFALPQTIVTLPLLFLLVPRLGVEGAALAMLSGFAASAVFALTSVIRLLRVTASDIGGAIGPLVVCAAFVAVALLVEIGARPDLPPLIALAASTATAVASYALGIATVGRAAVRPLLKVFGGRRPSTTARAEGALS